MVLARHRRAEARTQAWRGCSGGGWRSGAGSGAGPGRRGLLARPALLPVGAVGAERDLMRIALGRCRGGLGRADRSPVSWGQPRGGRSRDRLAFGSGIVPGPTERPTVLGASNGRFCAQVSRREGRSPCGSGAGAGRLDWQRALGAVGRWRRAAGGGGPADAVREAARLSTGRDANGMAAIHGTTDGERTHGPAAEPSLTRGMAGRTVGRRAADRGTAGCDGRRGAGRVPAILPAADGRRRLWVCWPPGHRRHCGAMVGARTPGPKEPL